MMHLVLLLGLLMGSQAENSLSQYWEEHIGLPHPPHWLTAKASPLNLYQATTFMKLIEENELASHLFLFCKQANVACSTNAPVKNTTDDITLPPIAQWNAAKLKYDDLPNKTSLLVASQGGLPYFRESMVKEGCFMPIPDLRDPISYKSFLPRSLASKIPFSFAKNEELKKIFGVVNESNMDEYIKDTLAICEKSPIRGELCTCVTSAEDLIDFAVEKLGHHVRIWSTESIEGSYENVTIGAVKLIYGNLSKPPVLCHSLPFPFQVYYCHVLPKVKVYVVDIHARKKVNHVIMACHHDTSTWNLNHISFKLLGFGPGLIEVCHWINENGVVWTKTLD
ncbi:polygalacturonase non-catalytic subunit AroGP2-like isoform X1 [Macadamia integrifolia]|uniref:polygalacturonase non-catalytic subunit AroGP2-like isoform X1 n=2 Tax=Macadamia integrifolia TaxID=60698 RepID=UPI001C527593|nr:polygalacturonase non-catalytic subunit AroGP2-like isoform X1 [Macadamia integrifolia]